MVPETVDVAPVVVMIIVVPETVDVAPVVVLIDVVGSVSASVLSLSIIKKVNDQRHGNKIHIFYMHRTTINYLYP